MFLLFLSDTLLIIYLPAVEEASSPVVKKSKAPKSTEVAPKPKSAKKTKSAEKEDGDVMPTSISKVSKKVNGAGASKKKAKEVISTSDDDDEVMADNIDDGSDSNSEIDDQTEALLKGFESDDDEAKVGDDGLKEGQEVPLIPKEKLSKTQKRQLEEAKNDEIPGVVYVGRIPHGFYENEMRQYFKQFGTIVNLRLSRNRKTGASKHYAFIQFETKTVADIVAMTMDNYLLFGHILKVKSVTDEQLSPDIWKGANKRFKKVPWNKLEGRSLNQGASEEKWEERITKEQQKRIEKADKLKAIGYDFEIPVIKSAKGVAKIPEITNGDEEVKVIEEIVAATEPKSEETIKALEAVLDDKPKGKGKKGKVVKQAKVEVIETEVPVVEETAEAKPKKEKKGKTVKAVVETITHEEIEIETPSVPAVEVEETVKPKAKKEKKTKAAKVVTENVVEEIEAEVAVEETKPKAKKEKKTKATKLVTESIVEEIVPEVAVGETKPKAKKVKKQKTVEVVADVDVPAEVPEKKLKAKKSKTTLAEKAVVPEEVAVIEKVKKGKKAKKESS